ncbi:hypothetical protein OAT82_03795, partial [Flavobacteriaceae bacterium]|nr:hypothetical protein [Flavobacteriaceae bacterium]
MKKYSLICALCSIFMLSAQEISMNLLENMAPRNIGPGGMSGRVTSIDAVHANPDIMYVGTASGGLWKSTSGGIKWDPIFDKELTASIGSIAIQQSNPSVLWVGTGEGNPRNSLNSGFGIYKSMDAGKTWKSMGLENTRHIHRVIIHPTNPKVVYVAAIGSPWGEHSDRGVYKTTDGGKTWNNILFKNDKTGAADLIMDPTNPNKLIATMWEHKRDPWFFKSGGEGSGLYITYDGGENWTKKTSQDGLPKGELGRIGVAIAPSKPTVIYALIESEKNALYRSVNSGDSWEKINDDMIGNIKGIDGVIDNRTFRIFSEPVPPTETQKERQMRRFYGGEVDGVSRQLARYIHKNVKLYMPEMNPLMVYRLDRFGRGGHHRPFNDAGYAGVRIMEAHENYTQQHQDLRVENGIG